jgi:hypothetical protein
MCKVKKTLLSSSVIRKETSPKVGNKQYLREYGNVESFSGLDINEDVTHSSCIHGNASNALYRLISL